MTWRQSGTGLGRSVPISRLLTLADTGLFRPLVAILAVGRRIIKRQRELVAGMGSQTSVNLLAVFERTQELFEAKLDALLKMK